MPSGQEIAAGGAPWYRVVAIPDAAHGGTPDRDYAAVLPAALDAARRQQPLVVGWFSRGGGAPLELVTNAGPLPSAPEGAGGPGPMRAVSASCSSPGGRAACRSPTASSPTWTAWSGRPAPAAWPRRARRRPRAARHGRPPAWAWPASGRAFG